MLLVRIIMFFTIIGVNLLTAQTTVMYQPTDEIFPNPERGFSAYRSTWLTPEFCSQMRGQNVTVVQRIHTMPQFRSDSISQYYLDLIGSDFNTAREGGIKLVLRFSYTNFFQNENNYGPDAALDTILLHLDQLEPLFQSNADVIAYVEAGFIGVWGEWYYSTHKLNNTNDRRSVLFKELSVLPERRAVVVRTPSYKRDIFKVYTALTPDSAFSGSYRARTGAHNDCFLASATDYGTYGNIEQDKTFLNLDNRYVPQGGETCNPSAYSGCENALKDLLRMHWSVLNKDYRGEVLNGWVTEGCMDEIKRRLGYRFELQESVMSDSLKPGSTFTLDLRVANLGFASPYNPRNLEIILRSGEGTKFFLICDADPRFWMSGDTVDVHIEAGIPPDMTSGLYTVMVHLADPEPELHNRVEYAIRLANDGIWEDSTGYNHLSQTLHIDPSFNGLIYEGDRYFKPTAEHPVGIGQNSTSIVDEYALLGNYPNPFNNATRIHFYLRRREQIRLEVYNIRGILIDRLLDTTMPAGEHTVTWNPGGVSSGAYFYRLSDGESSQIGKAIYLK